jgi:hypothetical protein
VVWVRSTSWGLHGEYGTWCGLKAAKVDRSRWKSIETLDGGQELPREHSKSRLSNVELHNSIWFGVDVLFH